MPFTDTAKKIVKDSILSSLYIDDKIVEPFEGKTAKNGKYFNVSKGLYGSFKKEHKSIDFYKFKSTRSWRLDADYIFKNRDLLVLDWQLDDAKDLKQTDTLEILRQAVETENLHFISIYTETPEHLFSDIFYIIKAYFEIGYGFESIRIFKEIISELDSEGIDTSFLGDIAGNFKDLSLNTDDSEALSIIDERIKAETGELYGKFRMFLKRLNPDARKAWEILGYALNSENFNDQHEKECDINCNFINNKFIVVNHTIIQLTSKNNPKPSHHFNFFTKAVLGICGNPLTLTSLEIRNLLRASSGFIGKEADNIDDAALFYHQSQKDNFFEFIIDIWKSHTLSYVDYYSNNLETLNSEFWKQYQEEKKIDRKLKKLEKQVGTFQKELAKLNIYYNLLNLNKPEDDRIKFGDVFMGLVPDTGKPDGKFWLNITAHCDCLQPGTNIKNNFYFITGENRPIEKSLADGDDGFNSYLKIDGEIRAIKWNNRPVILNITNSKMEKMHINATDGAAQIHRLRYIGTLKENYTQRMANNSFSFAMRVGIDFASFNPPVKLTRKRAKKAPAAK